MLMRDYHVFCLDLRKRRVHHGRHCRNSCCFDISHLGSASTGFFSSMCVSSAWLASNQVCCPCEASDWSASNTPIDQIHLTAQVHSPSIRSLDELPVVNPGKRRLHDEIHLVRRTPDAQDIIRHLLLEQSDDSTATACHGVLAI